MNYYSKIFDENYKYIVNDIISNSKFNMIDGIIHHGTTRLEHSLKVSYHSYKIAKLLHLDYISIARAGLLHDYYLERTVEYKKIKDKVKLFSVKHPSDAVYNASKIFNLSDKEKDIIKTHMFPVDYKIPKYLESWIVNLHINLIIDYQH